MTEGMCVWDRNFKGQSMTGRDLDADGSIEVGSPQDNR